MNAPITCSVLPSYWAVTPASSVSTEMGCAGIAATVILLRPLLAWRCVNETVKEGGHVVWATGRRRHALRSIHTLVRRQMLLQVCALVRDRYAFTRHMRSSVGNAYKVTGWRTRRLTKAARVLPWSTGIPTAAVAAKIGHKCITLIVLNRDVLHRAALRRLTSSVLAHSIAGMLGEEGVIHGELMISKRRGLKWQVEKVGHSRRFAIHNSHSFLRGCPAMNLTRSVCRTAAMHSISRFWSGQTATAVGEKAAAAYTHITVRFKTLLDLNTHKIGVPVAFRFHPGMVSLSGLRCAKLLYAGVTPHCSRFSLMRCWPLAAASSGVVGQNHSTVVSGGRRSSTLTATRQLPCTWAVPGWRWNSLLCTSFFGRDTQCWATAHGDDSSLDQVQTWLCSWCWQGAVHHTNTLHVALNAGLSLGGNGAVYTWLASHRRVGKLSVLS